MPDRAVYAIGALGSMRKAHAAHGFSLRPSRGTHRPAARRASAPPAGCSRSTARAGRCEDLQFRDFPSLLRPADLLVFNDTRVMPARVHGVKDSGGKIELLLERVLRPRTALVHARASKALQARGRGCAARRAQRAHVRPGGRAVSAGILGRGAAVLRGPR